jgi:acetyl-CoA acetyltransferase
MSNSLSLFLYFSLVRFLVLVSFHDGTIYLRTKALSSKGKQSGVITAGLASQICDGASAILICNEAGLRKLGVRPRARIVSLALAGTDPVMMLAGPIPATKSALERAKLTISDMDLCVVPQPFPPCSLTYICVLKGGGGGGGG